MKIIVDVSLSPEWVQLLTKAGIEAVHWATLGEANAADAEIMRFAVEHVWIIITHDLDFSAMLFESGAEKPSVVQLRAADVNPQVIGAAVVLALSQLGEELTAGAVITIDLNRTRLRLLPFPRRD